MSAIGVFSPIILLFFLAIGMTWYNEHKKKHPNTPKYARIVIPNTAGCPESKYHQWERGGWNGDIYHSGAVGRSGYRCYHCGEMAWDKTDEEYVNSQPQWLLESPDSKIAQRFLQYISKEVLDKRQENIDTVVIEKLQQQIKAAQETESTCVADLAELQ